MNLSRITHCVLVVVGSVLLSACVTTTNDALKDSALNGDALSQYKMGLRFNNGQGVTQNYTTALDWFEKSSARGNADAQYFSGIAYDAGRGVEQDQKKATTYFSTAAHQGHARAQYQYAQAYMNGRGVVKDNRWALVWYEKSANQLHSGSMFMLGVSYAAAIGVEQSDITSWAWLNMAAENNHPEADVARDKIGKRLTNADVAKAKKLSQLRGDPASQIYADPAMIKYVQFSLGDIGFDAGAVDGIYGPKTNKAVRAFRTEKGLDLGERVTPQLLDALRTRVAQTL